MIEIFAVPPDPDPEPDTPTMPTEAFATVRITVLGEDTCPQNWWLCCPPPAPEPIPERPTGFVPLDQYDLEFTYPLKSSRKLFKDDFWDGCVNCGPVYGPEPEPAPCPPEQIGWVEWEAKYTYFYYDWD